MIRLRAVGPGALLLTLAILAATAAAALGYWDGTGTGTTTTQIGGPQTLSFAPGTPTSQLYPGGQADVATVVSNPNPYVIRIGSLVLNGAVGQPFVVDAGHGGCDVAALSFVSQDNGGAGWQIPARVGATAGTLAIDLPAAMRMSATAANACQGATFTVALEGRP